MNVFTKHFPTDLQTPLALYAKLRDMHPQSVLFESFQGTSKTVYIGCEPLHSIESRAHFLKTTDPYGNATQLNTTELSDISSGIDAFLSKFRSQIPELEIEYPLCFGYLSHEAVQYFDAPMLKQQTTDLPWMYYALYRYVFVIPMDAAEGICIEHTYDSHSTIETLFSKIDKAQHFSYPFQKLGEAQHFPSDKDFCDAIEKAQHHIQRGDVFQLVLSKSIIQPFQGDDFEVYRALRRKSPMPYQFYFDFGHYKLMGASPEAQLEYNGVEAKLHPIAGTFATSGCKEKDALQFQALANDPKEQAEHAMLVDLARNDLSKNCKNVMVNAYSQPKSFSHVMHLVSEVSGCVNAGTSPIQLLGDTFPAGTLSGAPKFRALQLIDALEASPRHFYGGTIGFFGSKNQMTKAIMIRTLCSRNQELHMRAGAGIVSASKVTSELQEVYHKLAALKHAINEADIAVQNQLISAV